MPITFHHFLFVLSTTTILVTGTWSWEWPDLSNLLASPSSEKCMEEFGCFKAVPKLFVPLVYTLPDDREQINVSFLLYTPKNPDTPQAFSNLHGDTSSISTSFYDPKANTKIVVGGFVSDTSGEWKKPMVDALLKDNGNNVFLVDWKGGDGPLYDSAVANTRVVGAEIALFIENLQNVVGLKPQNVHIIGHSLGSQIAGFAGKRVKNLGRITGLDPAGPSFTFVDPTERLDRNDALFVDIIHTDKALSVFGGLGIKQSIGHIDFFPNGGSKQPGCKDMGFAVFDFLKNPSHTENHEAFLDLQCNHLRSLYLFISSIQNTECKLWGAVCDNWYDYDSGKCGSCKDGQDGACIPLGLNADQYSSKIKKDQSINVYLNTTAKEPFC